MSVIDDRVKKLLQLVDRPVSATEVSSVVGFGRFPVSAALDALADSGEAEASEDAGVRRYRLVGPPKLEVVE